MSKREKYNALVSMFIDSDEIGYADEMAWKIVLYGIPNEQKVFNDIRRRIDAITKNYKFVVLDKNERHTNINILDIEL